MIHSVDLKTLNRMNPQKLLFGDGTCDTCGGDETTINVGGLNYCKICFINRVDNQFPEEDEDYEPVDFVRRKEERQNEHEKRDQAETPSGSGV